MSNEIEIWRDVIGYEGHYRVSSLGRVMSLKTRRAGLCGSILKPQPKASGYLNVGLHKDGKQSTRLIHQLVAAAFCPNPENKPWVNHIDTNRAHNRAQNLEWSTPTENTLHGVHFGVGTGAPRKLTDEQAEHARTLRRNGATHASIASLFGVTGTTIRNIVQGRAYKRTNAERHRRIA